LFRESHRRRGGRRKASPQGRAANRTDLERDMGRLIFLCRMPVETATVAGR
jgi:hypothetical protein